ncbi:hypothetical protein EW145_g3069 [Phellinidium pouzarii]|uniref:NAD(P)-binding protein n=1 Tax=Phellinidium pouzarii TaxID=167371 RepID=A0A4S4L8N1_9AGAM|nr:hypothetical protein EW145_g3069 [Phellinidium pouzarii]
MFRIQSRLMSSGPSVRRQTLLERFSMKGKVCLVTGAAQGLGYEFCRAFIETGCTRLAILDLKDEAAQRAAREIKESYKNTGIESTGEGLDIVGFGCNVASEALVRQTFEKVLSHFGHLDAAFISTLGVVENYPALDYPNDRIRRLFDVNFYGAFYTAREAARHMVANGGGSIVLISSMSADIVNIPQPQAPYNASKAALKHLAASLAVEWASKNVRVNTLRFAVIRSFLSRSSRSLIEQDHEINRTWKSMTPMGRLGEPDDISGAAIFLCSDASRFITGGEIVVDGGYCLT